jgi:protein-S-isoprenylcysteine O-methyltransferase Ste14
MMISKIIFSLLPAIFVIHLFITEYLLYKKGIKLDGKAPINKYLFFGSKYAVVVIWTGMVLEIWNISIPGSINNIPFIKVAALAIWVLGFVFLYVGRFSLGNSFRIGVANEKTAFVARGIYKISRNPMYLALYLTFIGCMLYTLNIFYIVISIVVLVIHHIITIAEEKQLNVIYGDAYKLYCNKVRRYL